MNETNIIFLVTSFSARCAIKPIFIDFYRLRNVFNRLKTRFSQFQKKHPHIILSIVKNFEFYRIFVKLYGSFNLINLSISNPKIVVHTCKFNVIFSVGLKFYLKGLFKVLKRGLGVS